MLLQIYYRSVKGLIKSKSLLPACLVFALRSIIFQLGL